MRNECDIVGDLLFSYNDGVLSNSSKELVDEIKLKKLIFLRALRRK